MKTLFILVLAVLSNVSAFSQNVVTGIVKDNAGKAVPFANILLTKATDTTLVKGALTDENGRFKITGVKKGNYLVVISTIGFIKKYTPVVITNQAVLQLDPIQLKANTQYLAGVTVKASKPFIELQSDKLVVNISNHIISGGENALDILGKAPEVTVNPHNSHIKLRNSEGVQIMINGRPTHLSADALASLLKSMPASNIQKLEIMTNPSAKYSAEGTAGIINIVTKKNKNLGTNGSIILGGKYGKYAGYNTSLDLNHRDNKINWYTHYRFSHNRTFSEDQFTMRYHDAGRLTGIHKSDSKSEHLSNNHNFIAGLDWNIGGNSSAGVAFRGAFSDIPDANTHKMTQLFSVKNKLDSVLKADASSNGKEHHLSGSAYFKHTFDTMGRKISLEADYVSYAQKAHASYNNYYETTTGEKTGTSYRLKFKLPIDIDIKVLKADYEHPFKNNWKLEAGLKYSYVKTNNDAHYELFNSGKWENDEGRTNHFIYDETVDAAYASLFIPIKKTSIKAGLRAEQTISTGTSLTMDSIVKRDYTNLFPSLFISHKFNQNNTLNLSYSRRINRPDYGNLNPFITFLDLYTVDQGNPFLQPEYVNYYDITYVLHHNFLFSASYQRLNDVMSIVNTVDPHTQKMIIMHENLNHAEGVDLSTSANFNIASWWQINSNASAYYINFSNQFGKETIKNNAYGASLSISQDFILPADYKAELYGRYSTPEPYGYVMTQSGYRIDFSIQKSFLKGKLDVNLKINDLFNSNKTINTMHFQGTDMHETWSYESRKIQLTLAWHFGNNKVKKVNKHRAASKDEENRI